MMAKEELEDLAREQCARHAQQAIKTPVEVSVDSQQQAWDPVLLRTRFFQQMSMWRNYGKFDVITDSNLAVVGYVDHDKLEGEGGGALSREELLALFQAEPLVPRTASLVEIGTVLQASGMQVQRAVLNLRWPVAGLNKLEVLINAKRRAIASLRPLA